MAFKHSDWRKINFITGQTPGSTSVSNSNTEILAANTARRWCVLTNIGNKDVWVAMGQTALVNKGMLLGRSGGSVVMGNDFMCVDAVNGITSSGSSTIAFQEGQ